MSRRRLPLALLALLLLGLLVQPMMVAACAAHDAAHLLATGHGHASGHEDGFPDDEATADPWIELIHLGQCCAHGGSITAAPVAWGVAIDIVDPPRHGGHERDPPTLAGLLRPPIG